jgi:hypothetical protein
MALAFDAASTGTGTNTNSVTFAHTCTGSDRGLVVGIAAIDYGGDPTFSATYNSTSMTDKGLISNPSYHANQFTLAAPSSGGSYNVVITIGVVNCDAVAGAISYTGVDQTTGFSAKTTNTGSDTTPTVNVSSATGEVVVDCCSAANALTVGSGQTERWNTIAGVARGGGSTEDGGSSVTMSWSQTTGNWAISALCLKPTATLITNGPKLLIVAAPMIWR